MTDKTSGANKGLLESLTMFAATLVAMAQTRLELLSTDLEEEREHFFSLLVLSLATLFFLGVGMVLAAILLVAVFWDTHRLLVLGSLAGLFLAAGLAAWLFAKNKTKRKPRLFAASLSELLKDRQQLISRL